MVINIEELIFFYDGSQALIFDHVSLKLDNRWKLGLIGRNGVGKSTLLRILSGELECAGSISTNVDFIKFPPQIPVEKSARQSKIWSDRVEHSKNGVRVSGVKPDKGHIGHQAAKMMKQ